MPTHVLSPLEENEIAWIDMTQELVLQNANIL